MGCGPNCSVGGCERPREVGAECRAHYAQRLRHGTYTKTEIRSAVPARGIGIIRCGSCSKPLADHDLRWICR